MKEPNIVFIYIDDLGYKDLSCYGSSFYETPNIDKLADTGMKFTDGYAPAPVCSPSRSSVMTGLYPVKTGITNYIKGEETGKLLSVPYRDYLPVTDRSLPFVLKTKGYQTWHVGKWHLGNSEYYPEKHGFDVNIGGCDLGYPRSGYFSPYDIDTLEDGPDGEFLTDRLTDEAINLLEQRDKGCPFYLNLWHYAVHIPVEAKPEDIEYFKRKKVRMGLDKTNPFEKGENFPCDHKKEGHVIRRKIQSDEVYAALIYNLDQNVGRIIDYVDSHCEIQ